MIRKKLKGYLDLKRLLRMLIVSMPFEMNSLEMLRKGEAIF